jgi:hypothetical protein
LLAAIGNVRRRALQQLHQMFHPTFVLHALIVTCSHSDL